MRRSARQVDLPARAGAPSDPGEWVAIDAARRDPGQFGALYEAHFERVYAFVARRVKGREEIEDLTSEVFRRALAALPKYQSSGAPFSAWLLRIAANAIVDTARRAKRPGLHVELAEPSAEEQLDAAGRERLFRAVAKLPGEQRRVIELRFAEEQPIRAIADALGKSEGAIKQLQLRALRGLRKLLSESHHG
jgi:RNA polymerase sigma-70 factor (ECF subfamily)